MPGVNRVDYWRRHGRVKLISKFETGPRLLRERQRLPTDPSPRGKLPAYAVGLVSWFVDSGGEGCEKEMAGGWEGVRGEEG